MFDICNIYILIMPTIEQLDQQDPIQGTDDTISVDKSGTSTTKKVSWNVVAKGIVTIIAGSAVLLALLANAISPYISIHSLTNTSLNGSNTSTQGSLITFYNTEDQDINYERYKFFWDSNIFKIESQNGGTGSFRDIRIGTENRFLNIGSVQSPMMQFRSDATSNDLAGVTTILGGSGMIKSNGTQNAFIINPTITQTSTAGYNMLLIRPTEASIGTGTHYLIQAGTSTEWSLFTVDNKGNTMMDGKITSQGFDVGYVNSNRASILNLTAPLSDPQESTMSTVLNLGSGNKEFVDWTIENYGTDHMASINIAKSGSGILVPFSIRHWNTDLGNNSSHSRYDLFIHPDTGFIGLGTSSSTPPDRLTISGYLNASGTKLGKSNQTNIDYHGTFDGCTAIIWSASNTAPTYTPTSTSFCP